MFVQLERIATTVAGGALFAMMLIMSADAFMRYVRDRPIQGVQEIVIYFLMPATIWLAMADTERQDGHIRMRLLVKRLRPDRMLLVTRINLLIALGVILAIVIAVLRATNLRWGATLSGAYSLPTGPSWLLIAIGAVLFGVRIVLNIILTFKGQFPDPDDTGKIKDPTEVPL